MLLKTILNDCLRWKSFVYGDIYFSKDRKSINVPIKARKNGQAFCSVCKKPCSVYDSSKSSRDFESLPILSYRVFFVYFVRRVNCPCCGVKVEYLPWADGKKSLTIFYMKYLADWCRHLSWKEVSCKFHVSWNQVYASVEWVVEYGLKQRVLKGIQAIGVDEIQWKKNHQYLTLVYEISKTRVRLLWIGEKRTEKSFRKFFDLLGEKSKDIRFVCLICGSLI